MGSPPRPSWVARVPTTSEEIDLLSGRLWLAGAEAVAEEPGVLVASFPDRAAAEAAAAQVGGAVEAVDPAVWLDAWRDFARPVAAGRLVVVPAWIEPVRIDIDPGRAFGHGGHPTTRLLLEWLDANIRGGESVLDVGCGSGVLSVAAARLGAGRVVAVDLDPHAVEVTIANAGHNGVTVEASTTRVSGLDGPFDVVLANIGAEVLRDLAPDLQRLGGTLVLSGLLEDRWGDVAARYAGTPAIATLEGWVALVYEGTSA